MWQSQLQDAFLVSVLQGYNRIIVFSRPFYFCVCGALVLALHYAAENWTNVAFDLYGMPFTTHTALVFARDLVKSTSSSNGGGGFHSYCFCCLLLTDDGTTASLSTNCWSCLLPDDVCQRVFYIFCLQFSCYVCQSSSPSVYCLRSTHSWCICWNSWRSMYLEEMVSIPDHLPESSGPHLLWWCWVKWPWTPDCWVGVLSSLLWSVPSPSGCAMRLRCCWECSHTVSTAVHRADGTSLHAQGLENWLRIPGAVETSVFTVLCLLQGPIVWVQQSSQWLAVWQP